MFKIKIVEKKHLKENVDPLTKSEEFSVEMNPKDFNRLTPYEETIGSRAEKISATGYSPIKASAEGGYSLLLDPKTGKVLEHQGRARASAAASAGFNTIPVTIKIANTTTGASQNTSWAELPDKFIQQNGRNTVEKEKITLIGLEEPRSYRAALKQPDGSLKMLGGLFKLSTLKTDPKVLNGEKIILTRTPDETLRRSYNPKDFETVDV